MIRMGNPCHSCRSYRAWGTPGGRIYRQVAPTELGAWSAAADDGAWQASLGGGLGLDGDAGMRVTTVAYILSSVVLVASAATQAIRGQRGAACASLVFAGIALLWVLILAVVLPALATMPFGNSHRRGNILSRRDI